MILLSFDFEEFDIPCEYGATITPEERIRVSAIGAGRLLDCLQQYGVRATFFCTSDFAGQAPDIICRLQAEGHEIASHGCSHSHFQPADLLQSKQLLEQQTGLTIAGYRQPRLASVNTDDLQHAGYRYSSSLNPTFLPGRYMHLTMPRTAFKRGTMLEIPSSVTPWLRIPLFWLSLHNMSEKLYHRLVLRTLRHDGYFMTYFHPWEFYDLQQHPEYNLPYYIRRHSGLDLLHRLSHLVQMLQATGHSFVTFSEFAG